MRGRSRLIFGLTLALGAGSLFLSSPSQAERPDELATSGASAHVAYSPDRAHAQSNSARPNNRVLMTNHGGKVLTTASTQAIFWGSSWGSYVGDKMTGIDSWYTGYSGSKYALTSTEYSGSNGKVGSTTTHLGHVVDSTPASGGGNTNAILAEVTKMVLSPEPAGNGYYAVYTDLPRGNAGYCAWHSVGTVKGVQVQFAFFWKLDGDPGCDPQDPSTTWSQGLEALVNVTGHELAEAMTDPALNAWYDGSGAENGDKCAWTFGAPTVPFSNGTSWRIQGEWSNSAYSSGTGYPNSSGQKGCLSGA